MNEEHNRTGLYRGSYIEHHVGWLHAALNVMKPFYRTPARIIVPTALLEWLAACRLLG